MKKMFIAAMLLVLGAQSIMAQSVVREGNTFKSVTKSIAQRSDTLATQFEYEDSKGTKYPIVVNKNSGACYIWRVSQKTGKAYKSYLKAEICEAVCKELKIEYKPKNKK